MSEQVSNENALFIHPKANVQLLLTGFHSVLIQSSYKTLISVEVTRLPVLSNFWHNLLFFDLT